MDIPELSDATGAVEGKARSLIPWLPSPMSCPECGAMTEASRTYDPQTAAFHPNGMAPSWYCESCDEHFRREEPWH